MIDIEGTLGRGSEIGRIVVDMSRRTQAKVICTIELVVETRQIFPGIDNRSFTPDRESVKRRHCRGRVTIRLIGPEVK